MKSGANSVRNNRTNFSSKNKKKKQIAAKNYFTC